MLSKKVAECAVRGLNLVPTALMTTIRKENGLWDLLFLSKILNFKFMACGKSDDPVAFMLMKCCSFPHPAKIASVLKL